MDDAAPRGRTALASGTGTAAPKVIEIVGLNKWFGPFHVLKDINLSVRKGERIVVCGPSGSGKSTLIRCINALEHHQEGDIVVNGHQLKPDKASVTTVRAEVGMVFQQFNLFPHLSVLENCTMALMYAKGMPKRAAEEIAMAKLARVRIPEQARKYPLQLSATARGDRARALPQPADHAVRRADFGA